MQDAVWSRDGTIIAVRGFNQRNGDGKLRYVDAYDFHLHKVLAVGILDYKVKSQHIQDLMAKRGGMSEAIIPYPGGGGQQNLPWLEAKQYSHP